MLVLGTVYYLFSNISSTKIKRMSRFNYNKDSISLLGIHSKGHEGGGVTIMV